MFTQGGPYYYPIVVFILVLRDVCVCGPGKNRYKPYHLSVGKLFPFVQTMHLINGYILSMSA